MNNNDPLSSSAGAPEVSRPFGEPPPRRRIPWRAALLVLGLVLMVVLIIRHSKRSQLDREHLAGGRDAPVSVATATAVSGDMPVIIPALGTVTPLATVTVKTQINGQITQIAFKEGQMVRQGDFLVQIDPRPYQAALDQALGNQRRDQALLANAKVDLERYRGLVAEDSIARQQLDTQEALVEQYQGTLIGDEAAVASARLNLQYAHIVSPVSGRVGLRQVDLGNYVTPGDANGLVVVTQLQPITVIFPVPEDYAPTVIRRLRDTVPLSVLAFDRTNTNKLADGKLLTVDNQIDASTGTIKLRAQFENEDGTMLANQFVNVQLLLDVLHQQIIIPNAAVHHGTPNGVTTAFVYRVKPDNTVGVQPVTLGMSNGELVAVTAGLSQGDVVVTEGGDRLREGAKIVPPNSLGPKPATANPAVTKPH
jgi:multidrug efflux system membrane fusion protein